MLHALVTNEVLNDVTFEFVDTNKDGTNHIAHIVKLTKALISGIRPQAFVTRGVVRHAYNVIFDSEQHVEMSFRQIEISNSDGKTTANDDWESRV